MDADRFICWSIGCLVFPKGLQATHVHFNRMLSEWKIGQHNGRSSILLWLCITIPSHHHHRDSRLHQISLEKQLKCWQRQKKNHHHGNFNAFSIEWQMSNAGSWKQISAPKKIAHLLVASGFLRLCLRLFFAKDQMILHWIWADVSELIQSSAAKRHQDKNHGISILWQIQSEKSPIQICLHIHFHGFSTAK